MDEGLNRSRGETDTHRELKRQAALWAQARGYSACALEVSLPKCRYRADVAAFRLTNNAENCCTIFEWKQARPDLRRDNHCASSTRQRLQTVQQRRQIIERNLRVHYPGLRRSESLFAEFDEHDFLAIGHRNYARVLRELAALQNRLQDGTKFETLARYRCANLFYLVLPNELFRPAEVPVGWGVLLENNGSLSLEVKPLWHDTTAEAQMTFLHRLALTGTRQLNKKLGISFESLVAEKSRLAI